MGETQQLCFGQVFLDKTCPKKNIVQCAKMLRKIRKSKGVSLKFTSLFLNELITDFLFDDFVTKNTIVAYIYYEMEISFSHY